MQQMNNNACIKTQVLVWKRWMLDKDWSTRKFNCMNLQPSMYRSPPSKAFWSGYSYRSGCITLTWNCEPAGLRTTRQYPYFHQDCQRASSHRNSHYEPVVTETEAKTFSLFENPIKHTPTHLIGEFLFCFKLILKKKKQLVPTWIIFSQQNTLEFEQVSQWID